MTASRRICIKTQAGCDGSIPHNHKNPIFQYLHPNLPSYLFRVRDPASWAPISLPVCSDGLLVFLSELRLSCRFLPAIQSVLVILCLESCRLMHPFVECVFCRFRISKTTTPRNRSDKFPNKIDKASQYENKTDKSRQISHKNHRQNTTKTTKELGSQDALTRGYRRHASLLKDMIVPRRTAQQSRKNDRTAC